MKTERRPIGNKLTLEQVLWNHKMGYLTPVNDGTTMEMLWEPNSKRYLKESDREVQA